MVHVLYSSLANGIHKSVLDFLNGDLILRTRHLFLMEPRVAYLAMLILPLHFNDIFLLSCVCIFELNMTILSYVAFQCFVFVDIMKNFKDIHLNAPMLQTKPLKVHVKSSMTRE